MYKIQVLVLVDRFDGGYRKAWKDIHPTGGTAYLFNTEIEAENMRRICYGDLLADLSRVVPESTQEES